MGEVLTNNGQPYQDEWNVDWANVDPSGAHLTRVPRTLEAANAYAASLAQAITEHRTLFGDLPRDMAQMRERVLAPEGHNDIFAYANGDGVIVAGIGMVYVSEGEADLFDLFRLDAMEGANLGRQLLYVALRHAFEQGLQRVTLDVMPHNRAYKLYERIGFQAYLLPKEGSIWMELFGRDAIASAMEALTREPGFVVPEACNH